MFFPEYLKTIFKNHQLFSVNWKNIKFLVRLSLIQKKIQTYLASVVYFIDYNIMSIVATRVDVICFIKL